VTRHLFYARVAMQSSCPSMYARITGDISDSPAPLLHADPDPEPAFTQAMRRALEDWGLPLRVHIRRMGIHPVDSSARAFVAALRGLVWTHQGQPDHLRPGCSCTVRLIEVDTNLPAGLDALLDAGHTAQAGEVLQAWIAPLPPGAQHRLRRRFLQAFEVTGNAKRYTDALCAVAPDGDAVMATVMSDLYTPLWEATAGKVGLRARLQPQPDIRRAFSGALYVAASLGRWEEVCAQVLDHISP